MCVDTIARALACKNKLPEVTSADNGDVLTVVNGVWAKGEGGGGGGGGGISLLDKASMDGSAFAEDGMLSYELPVLFVFDSQNTETSAFTINSELSMQFASTIYDGMDVPLFGKAFIKDQLPGVDVYATITKQRGNNLVMRCDFVYDGKKYVADYEVAFELNEDTGYADATVINQGYMNITDNTPLTESEFYDIVDRVVIYFSVSGSELILPINISGLSSYFSEIEDWELTYADGLVDALLVQPNAKLFMCGPNMICTLVHATDQSGQPYGVGVYYDGSIIRLSFENWEDQEGNLRYIKASPISSPQITYKWSQIKNNLANIAFEMENMYYDNHIPISLYVDEEITEHTNYPQGLYQFVLSSTGPMFSMQDMRSQASGYLTCWDITFTEEDPYAIFDNHWISLYYPE